MAEAQCIQEMVTGFLPTKTGNRISHMVGKAKNTTRNFNQILPFLRVFPIHSGYFFYWLGLEGDTHPVLRVQFNGIGHVVSTTQCAVEFNSIDDAQEPYVNQ